MTDPLAGTVPLDDIDIRPPAFTDDALALRFAEKHEDDLRFVAAWSRWLIYDGTRWAVDDTMRAFDLSRFICRQASAECNNAKTAVSIASSKTVAAVERLAKADRRHAATTGQWDQDEWKVNTSDGTVALVTAALEPHRRADYMTKITSAAPGGTCSTWMEFLNRVTDGDIELQRYLQRVVGYSLTGCTREHSLFFLYGTGANGKSVLINTISGLMGDYAVSAPMDTFLDSRGERHPTELAMLRGARLVVAVETEEGRRWSEAKLKALTGGDRITARFMRQDFFEFTPQFKLMIAGNHKPSLRSVDEAIRRRLHLIPFTVTIPPEERDERLADKLKLEWPGIMQWAVEGCLEWQRIGLAPPEAVRAATEEYLDQENAFAQWFEECCQRTDTGHETTADLFTSWKGWAERTGEFVGSQKRLAQNMLDRGFESGREGGTGRKVFNGIRLIRADYSDDPRYP